MRRNTPQATAATAATDTVTLQWANGKTNARPAGSGARFQPLVGFHIECGKNEALDACLHAAGMYRIEIKHQRDGGSEVKPHWGLGESVEFFPVTAGPRYGTVAQLVKHEHETIEDGLACVWPQGERSRLAVQGFVRALAEAGYVQPVVLSTRSKMTDVLLGALLDHARVCEAADSLVDRARHPEIVCFHEIALPLAAGEEAEWGKGDTATVVPFVSAHPTTIDLDYIREFSRPESVDKAARAAWDGIVAWAAEYGRGGNGNGEGY